MSEGVVRSLGSGRFLDWRALDADGAAGGLLICWDKRSMEVVDWEEGQYSLSCRFKNVEDGAVWVFTGVYGPFTKEAREGLWEELGVVRGIWDEPWCLGDLPMQGGVFTWSGGLNNQSWARLDRFLVSPSWLDKFSGVIQRRLPRPVSNHFPILLEGGGLRRGPSPFRGTASYRLAAKTKELKQKLKVWNREVFGNLEGNKRAALQQVDYWDESHWRQLSREVWLKEGDKNTGFFHRMANAHRNNNTLDKVKIDGVWLEEDQEVREGIANAFHQRLSEDVGWKADIEGIQLDRISQQEAESLEIPFSENEIHSALMEMSGDKAPGPDGFTMAFWQSSWDFVKEEILEMFKEFHEQGSFLKSLNNTFLVLIPKKGGADDLGDFRPISLLGGLYKLMAKVLANRLKRVLNKVVAPTQNAFVMGRQILDASLIANEFLLKTLHKMGFGPRWLGWMWSCISTAKFSVLVNGVPAGFFPSSKGLRQGDPLSPYLFVLGMEVLDALIRRAVAGGYLSGCSIKGDRRHNLKISHLFFADDTIVFCEANKEHLTHLSWILLWFEAASGLRINLDKSEIIPVGVVEEIEEMAVELGCKVGSLPSHYLGLPLGAPHKASSVWDGVEEKVRRRLARWKRGSEEKKAHLIKWEAICEDKSKGGLGLRKLVLLNKALLGKWVWRFAIDRDVLWKQVIIAKYGQEGHGWRAKKAYGTIEWGFGRKYGRNLIGAGITWGS
ncbi:LINE-1 retrotransposable element ORF2 protein [Vitis vinifera]|uniref:LINE-1 retrotransposable element ORF2 protein n=1 Tax=Vitis vinifera TaxID=29760 RepID=A0A438IEK8_VITVI|nr:LINE-1 retrotransposable element ORF2 protein [Vitis vinifera]